MIPKTINFSAPEKQKGLALLAALLIVTIMALIGFRIAEQGKDNTAIVGSDVRYNQVFEAGEQTLRNAMAFIQAVHHGVGVPYGTSRPDKNYIKNKKAIFSDFDIGKITEEMSTSPSYSFVWDSGALAKKVCGETSGKINCPSGVDFHKYLDGKGDADIWKDHAIETSFSSGIDSDNYLSNIRTYTFIEVFDAGGQAGSPGGGGGQSSEMTAGSGGAAGKNYYYLITVKASGYPPGTKEKEFVSKKSRENVLLQAIYLQR